MNYERSFINDAMMISQKFAIPSGFQENHSRFYFIFRGVFVSDGRNDLIQLSSGVKININTSREFEGGFISMQLHFTPQPACCCTRSLTLFVHPRANSLSRR